MNNNKYQFKVSNYTKFLWITMSYICLIIILIGYVGASTHNGFLAFVTFVVPTIIFASRAKRLMGIVLMEVELSDESLQISTWGLSIPLSEINWYRIDNGGIFVQVLVLNSYKYGTTKIYFYTKDVHKQWDDFLDDFKIRFEITKPSLPNYFDSKKWNYVIAAMVASLILIPIVLFSLGIGIDNIKKITPSFLIYTGSCATFIGAVVFNRQKRSN